MFRAETTRRLNYNGHCDCHRVPSKDADSFDIFSIYILDFHGSGIACHGDYRKDNKMFHVTTLWLRHSNLKIGEGF